jgi:transposase
VVESTTIIAFDQHAASVVAAVLRPGDSTAAVQELPPDLPAIGRFVARVAQTGAVQCCYEAGPCGFALQRYLQRHGAVCDVIAPGLIPKRPGDRVKTDRRDARQLAVLFRAGALTPVHVPSEDEEAVRDLLRCREDALTDLIRARHRLSKFLLRHDQRYTKTKRAWNARHTEWLSGIRLARPALQQTLTAYLRAVDEAHARLETLEGDLREYLTVCPFADRVQRLQCFRGISDLTALTIAAELGDARRFPSATTLMGFVGLVPSEHSSGSHRGRGTITKTGNAHLRRVLVEAAWHYRHGPHVGRQLRARQRDATPAQVAQAWKAQHRLARTYRRLSARGKPHQVAVTAVARELAGFVGRAAQKVDQTPLGK